MIDEKSLFFITFIISWCNAQYIGDVCTFQNSKSRGVCEEISGCPKAISDLKKGIIPTPCGFDGTTPIVCCDKSSSSINIPTLRPARSIGKISDEKCREYGSHVWKVIESPILGDSKKVNVSLCISRTLIVGGETALSSEFPHQAILGYDIDGEIEWLCGGALISEDYVITAAHCLNTSTNGSVKYVRLGDLNYKRTDDDAHAETFTVERSIPHPNYKPPRRYHNIALLKLDRPVAFNKFIRPVCLQTEFVINDSTHSGQRFFATGYARPLFAGDQNTNLLKATIKDLSHKECSDTFKNSIRRLSTGIDDNTQICAGCSKDQTFTCQDDDGGPLQVFHDKVYCMYKLVGVTSFGRPCAPGVRIPGIYTRVSHYIEWIEKEVWGAHS